MAPWCRPRTRGLEGAFVNVHDGPVGRALSIGEAEALVEPASDDVRLRRSQLDAIGPPPAGLVERGYEQGSAETTAACWAGTT